MAEYISPYDGCRFDTDFIPREAARCLMYHTQMPLTEKDLMSIPSADVAPVRHGRWIFKVDSSWRGGGKYECSACKYGYAIGAYHDPDEFTYCPHCGAYMMEGRET